MEKFSCIRNLIWQTNNSRLINHEHGSEAAREQAQMVEFKGEKPFDPQRPWQANVTDLLTQALRERANIYKPYLDMVTTTIDEAMVLPFLPPPAGRETQNPVAYIALAEGVLMFQDKNRKLLASKPVGTAMYEMITYVRERRCEACRADTSRRIALFGQGTFGAGYPRAIRDYDTTPTAPPAGPSAAPVIPPAGQAGAPRQGQAPAGATQVPTGGSPADGRKTAPSAPAPAPRAYAPPDEYTKRLLEYQRRYVAQVRENRGQILATAVTEKDFDKQKADIDSRLRGADDKTFLAVWTQCDYSSQIDDLLTEVPGTGPSGVDLHAWYQLNPFKFLNWDYRTIRDMIAESVEYRDGKVYGKPVTLNQIFEKIYEDKFDILKKELEKKGIPEVVLDLLDDDDLVGSYKKVKEVAEELSKYTELNAVPDRNNLKELFKNEEKVQLVLRALGDYIGYSVRLLNLLRRLKYNPGQRTTDRRATMTEMEEPVAGYERGNRGNEAKAALTTLFVQGMETPQEYAPWYERWFSSRKLERTEFTDLTGQKCTLEGEWFTTYESPETAYRDAFEAAQTVVEKPDGAFEEDIDLEAAKRYLNHCLQTGIAAYSSVIRSEDRESIPAIMNRLGDAGVRVSGTLLRFNGNLQQSQINLFHALEIKDLTDIYATSGDPRKNLLLAERRRFIRIGSVVYRKAREREQRERAAQREAQRENPKGTAIRLSREQARDITHRLLRTNPQFTNAELQDIEDKLVGGAVVVLPKYGGIIDAHISLPHGFSLDIGAAFPNWETVAPGAAVGKKFQLTQDVSITINAGAGYSFASAGGGWTVGTSTTITKRLESCDVHITVGAGLGITALIPSASFGVGFDWTQQSYRQALSREQSQQHTAELDRGDPYEMVKRSPTKYPELAQILFSIENARPKLDDASARSMFLAAYDVFKESIQRQAIERATSPGYKPTGVGFGLAVVGGVPVPYFYLKFDLWKRNVVRRIASTSLAEARAIADDAATAAILEDFEKNHGQKAEIKTETVRTSGTLFFEKDGTLSHRVIRNGRLDFSQPNPFQDIRTELARDAQLLLDPVTIGGRVSDLMELKPVGANGEIELYIDPALKDNVVVITIGSHVYLSIKKGSPALFVKREDISYPFLRRGVTETTMISISTNPRYAPGDVKEMSAQCLSQRPKETWVRRPAYAAEIPEDRPGQDNLMNWQEYQTWQRAGGHGERIRPAPRIDVAGLTKAHDDLETAIGGVQREQMPDSGLKPEVARAAQKLVADRPFMERYMLFSTERHEFHRPRGRYQRRDITESGPADYASALHLINEEIHKHLPAGYEGPTIEELNTVYFMVFNATLQNLRARGDARAEKLYTDNMERFHRPMLEQLFKDYFKSKGDTDPDAKAKQATEWVMQQFKDSSVILAQGEQITPGTLFRTLVGMRQITGTRQVYDVPGTNDPEARIVGKRELDIKSPDAMVKMLAQMWLETTSSYAVGAHLADIPPPEPKEAYEAYQKKIFDNLHSPLVLKLAPLVSVIFTKEEMETLTKIYKAGAQGAGLITKDTMPAIKKLLSWCDKARQAELNGEKELKLDDRFTIKIDIKIAMGIYRRCGNISGLVNETFVLEFKKSATERIVYAASSEYDINVRSRFGQIRWSLLVGAALPIVTRSELGPEQPPPPPEKPPPKPPPPKPPPPPPPIPEGKPGEKPGVGTSGGDTSGGATDTPPSAGEGGEI